MAHHNSVNLLKKGIPSNRQNSGKAMEATSQILTDTSHVTENGGSRARRVGIETNSRTEENNNFQSKKSAQSSSRPTPANIVVI